VSGICGIVNLEGGPVDRVVLERMVASLRFRGPDAQGTHLDGGVGLGHTLANAGRGSAAGRQPLTLDGQVWIVSDARIDGRLDLSEELRRDHPALPRSALEKATHPELILLAYACWGVGCLDHLRGDFSFALWDGKVRRLLCAVDQFGVKPFFYARVGTSFVFSNNLNSVCLHPLVGNRLDETAIGDVLLFGRYLDPGVTIYGDVRRLPPAHALVLDGAESRLRRYWTLPDVPELRLRRPEEYVEQFQGLLDESVRDRVREPRASISLSGGLDSSLVAATTLRVLRERFRTPELTASTVVFDHLIPDSDRPYAELAAGHLGIPIFLHRADDEPPDDWPDRTEWFPPEPGDGLLFNPGPALMRDIASRSPLHLTGYDGDAILGSSVPLYWRECLRGHRWGRLIQGMAWYVLHERGLPPIGFRARLARRSNRDTVPRFPARLEARFVERARLLDRFTTGNRSVASPFASREPSRRILGYSWSFFLDAYDPGWTRCALEVVHPLMDLRLVQFALSLPAVPWCVEKYIVRRCLRGFPAKVRLRPKTPLPADIVVAKVRKGLRNPNTYWRPCAEMAEFVGAKELPAPSPDDDFASIYFNMRAMILNTWLVGRRGRRTDD